MHTQTHSVLIGYLTWLLGFTGAHRFYFGRPVSGTIYFFTFGLLGVGWVIDLFLIPSLAQTASWKYEAGPVDYNLTWLLLAWLGPVGVHRFYMGRWISGGCELAMTLLIVGSGGFLAIIFGLPLAMMHLIDLWSLNEQVDDTNRRLNGPA